MRIICCDARNALYRFGWTGKTLKADSGQDTGALHGLLGGLLALKRRFADAKFVVVWDGELAHQSWRDSLFPEYRANRRGEITDQVRALRASVNSQVKIAKRLLTVIGVSQIEVPEMEADDLIGIMTEKCAARGWQVAVYSSDQDYLQLMAFGVSVFTSAAGAAVRESDVMRKWRVGTDRLLAVRAMLGDKSDGIPHAVSGVGPVAAASYIQRGVDPSISNFDDMPRAVREDCMRLRAAWDRVHRNWRLMRILRSCTDSELPAELQTHLTRETRRVLKELASTPGSLTADYQEFLSLTGSLDMLQAIANRAELWRLQQVRDDRDLTH